MSKGASSLQSTPSSSGSELIPGHVHIYDIDKMKGGMNDLLIFHEHHDFASLHEAIGEPRKDEKGYNGPTDTEKENVSNIVKEPASSHVEARREDDRR